MYDSGTQSLCQSRENIFVNSFLNGSLKNVVAIHYNRIMDGEEKSSRSDFREQVHLTAISYFCDLFSSTLWYIWWFSLVDSYDFISSQEGLPSFDVHFEFWMSADTHMTDIKEIVSDFWNQLSPKSHLLVALLVQHQFDNYCPYRQGFHGN